MADAFWGKKKDSRSGVVHLFVESDWPRFYRAKCIGLFPSHGQTEKVSSEQIVHFLRCKRCLAAMVKEENKQC